MRLRHRRQRRAGNVLVLTVFLMAGCMALLAMAIDLGYIQVASTQLQRSADAAAIASAWELVENSPLTGGSVALSQTSARTAAGQYVALNNVSGGTPTLAFGDTTIGYLQNPSDRSQTINTAFDPVRFNTVQVRVRKAADTGGELSLFFARVLGMNSVSKEAVATAAFINNFKGFNTPSSGDNLGFLPIALDKQTWDALMAGGGSDNWNWDAGNKCISSGGDGIREVNLYPQGTGSPGNRGTVDIGSNNNSTCDISRQIRTGISPADMAAFKAAGRTLEFNAQGQFFLNGDTGISAGVKDDLASICGQTRIIPIFNSVSGNGNNAEYTIVGFAGVRIMEVKLTGSASSKRVIVQPATVTAMGGIPGGETQTSYYLFSPVWLVR